MGCGCSSCGSAQVARLVERMTVEDWGPDKTGLADDLGNQVTTGNGGEWLHITKPCGFVAIGPQSDWDVVVVEGPDLIGPTLVSVEHPLVAFSRASSKIGRSSAESTSSRTRARRRAGRPTGRPS
jgi:hypothetical protein